MLPLFCPVNALFMFIYWLRAQTCSRQVLRTAVPKFSTTETLRKLLVDVLPWL